MDQQIELANLRVAVAQLHAEVIRLEESLRMQNQGCLAMLEGMDILDRRIKVMSERLTATESWAGVPSD